MKVTDYPRDMVGYGAAPPNPKWPGAARLAVQVVMNYEEGGENCILHGDEGAETFLSEIVNAAPVPAARHMSMESLYEYGSRAGVWRLLRLFKRHQIPITVFAVAMALERHRDVAKAIMEDGHEICSHGYRWINYQHVDEATERAHIKKAVEIIEDVTGEKPLGWYTGRTSPNTRRLVAEHGGFLYDADDYNDDLPYWTKVDEKPHLVVPYTLDVNDMRFTSPQGFNCGDQFFTYLKDTFDVLYEEGASAGKMMSIGLHCRIVGRPGRAAALDRFFTYAKSFPGVWFCRRVDIARHWRKHHPFADGSAPWMGLEKNMTEGSDEHALLNRPSTMNEVEFLRQYGGIYENSPWIAVAAWVERSAVNIDTVEGLHNVMRRAVDEAGVEKQLALIRAHPDLAGKAAIAGGLTEASASEQTGAGLGQCTRKEFDAFQQLNDAYKTKFGFPFICAVKGLHRTEILKIFAARIANTPEEEFQTALEQIHKIARLRLMDRKAP